MLLVEIIFLVMELQRIGRLCAQLSATSIDHNNIKHIKINKQTNKQINNDDVDCRVIKEREKQTNKFK